LREVAREPAVREVLESVLEAARRDGATPHELVEAAWRVDPAVGDRLRSRASAFDVDLILNRADLAGSRDPGVEMAAATRAQLGANLRLAGSLQTDSSVPIAVARGVPVMQLFPGSGFSGELRRAVERLVADEPIPTAPELEPVRGRRPAAPLASPPPRMPAFDGISPGRHLRGCRELLGMTLNQLHERTRIRHHHLEGIESEQYAVLPPDFYLRAYVRQIAEVLQLVDGERIAECLLSRARERRPPPPRPGSASPPATPRTAPPVPKTEELLAIIDFEPELEGFSRSFGRSSSHAVKTPRAPRASAAPDATAAASGPHVGRGGRAGPAI
jgi:hypothetical protein